MYSMAGRRLDKTLEHSTKYAHESLHLALVHLCACCLTPAMKTIWLNHQLYISRRLSMYNLAKYPLAPPAENLLGQATCDYGNLPGYWAHKANSTVGTWTVLSDECHVQVAPSLLSGTIYPAPAVHCCALHCWFIAVWIAL